MPHGHPRTRCDSVVHANLNVCIVLLLWQHPSYTHPVLVLPAATLQVLWSAVVPGSATLAPSLIGAAAAALWLQQQPTPEKLRAAIAQLPGLCATAMFTLSPLPQLVRRV